jgi:hypothetical protein
MDATASRSSARALFEAHAPDSSLFHVGRALLGMHAEIADRGAMALGRGPSSPPDRPEITFSIEMVDDPEFADEGDEIDRLLALPVPAPVVADERPMIDAEALAAHLGRVFGAYVNEVQLISVADPYADASWLTEEALESDERDFAATLDACLETDRDGMFWGRLLAAHDMKLLRFLKEDGRERLADDVRARFEDGLAAALTGAVGGSVSDARLGAIRADVLDALDVFIGLAAMDDRSSAVPLGHLVREFTRALPLGMKKGEPGTWLFLVA